jgi:hypothetical protein
MCKDETHLLDFQHFNAKQLCHWPTHCDGSSSSQPPIPPGEYFLLRINEAITSAASMNEF